MTYFYRVFKKYTHFSLETTTKLADVNTSWPYDRTTQLRFKVERVGDLLTDCYFSFQIPAIYSKFKQNSNIQSEFQWVRYLGAAAIQSVYITVGPDKVQEFTGEYLMAKALIDYPKDKFEKWQALVGDVPTFNNPANGPFGTKTASGGQYPTVYYDDRNPSQAQSNFPSIPSATIYVPLPFWFTEEGQALPMIGLQYYTVEVVVNLTPSQQLYTILSANVDPTTVPNFTRMAPGYQVTSTQTNLVVSPNTPELGNTSDESTSIRNFLTDINYTVPQLNTWPANATLHTTYAFLPQRERDLFSKTPLNYVVREITLVPFPTIISNQTLDLKIHNPVTRLIVVPRRSDILMYRNAWENFTNWWNWPLRPKVPNQVPSNSTYTEDIAATGILIQNGQEDILRAFRVLADGNEIQEMKPNSFYTKLTPYRYLDGQSATNIPVYSFELHSPTSQPAGSINASRIRNFQLDIQVNPLATNSTYFYSLNVYVEALNFFLVESGMGRLKYAN